MAKIAFSSILGDAEINAQAKDLVPATGQPLNSPEVLGDLSCMQGYSIVQRESPSSKREVDV